tara:strand:- start:279 stop:1112 length:834 start_codon:yes stop_codon:yes gene_type:complete
MENLSDKKLTKILKNKTYLNKVTNKQTNYSDTTIKNYIFKFNQSKHLSPDEIYDKYKDLSAPYLSSILLILSDTLTDTQKNKIADLIKKSNSERRELTYTKIRTKDLDITIEDIQKILLSLEPTSQDYLLIKLYLANTLRDNYGNIKIVKRHSPKAKFNYINISKNRFQIVLNKYKTFNLYGQQVIPINKELQKLILDSIKLQPRKFLITQADGKKYSGGLLSSHILKIFKFSINDIRRAVINDLLNKQDHTLEERELLARQMGNSVSVQSAVYKRN